MEYYKLRDYNDVLCNNGIAIMHRLSELTGVSYLTLNSLLFLIIEPGIVGILLVLLLLPKKYEKLRAIVLSIILAILAGCLLMCLQCAK